MDIFKVNSTTYAGGQIVTGITKKTWIERYVEPGEFTFVAPVSSDLKAQLPLGTLISHGDTLELMMVEDHQIVDSLDADPVITVTGRSVDAFLEHRPALPNSFGYYNPTTEAPYTYDFTAAGTYTQAIILIREHIMSSYQLLNSQDNLPNVNVYYSNAPTEGTFYERQIKKGGNVDKALYDLLAVSGLGIKTKRPTYASSTLDFIVHKGLDRTTSVVFSHLAGDIAGGEYLWSNKKKKNGAIVLSKYWSYVLRPSGPTGFDVRLMVVDASDIEIKPAGDGSNFALLDRLLLGRANEALGKQKDVDIVSIGISPNNRYKYRVEYDVGDRVKVAGNYGAVQTMQVTEHVEIEDENGLTSYPTLAVV